MRTLAQDAQDLPNNVSETAAGHSFMFLYAKVLCWLLQQLTECVSPSRSFRQLDSKVICAVKGLVMDG